MVGRCRQVFRVFVQDGELGGLHRIALCAGEALFGEYVRPLLEEVVEFARVTRAGLLIAHRIDADDRLFVEQVARERDERTDNDDIRNRAVGPERVELDSRLLLRRAAGSDIRVPDEEGLARARCVLYVPALLEETRDGLCDRVKRKRSKRLRVRGLLTQTARFLCERGERREAVILADGMCLVQKLVRRNGVAHHSAGAVVVLPSVA